MDSLSFSRTYRLPDDIALAPDSIGGVYIICFRFPTRFELGLYDGMENFESVVRVIKRKVEVVFGLMSMKSASGTISDGVYGKHMRTEFSVIVQRLERNWIDTFDSEIQTIERNYENISDLVSLLIVATSELPPLYVGIAEKQSIRERLKQHRNGQTQLSERLEKNGILMTDLGFKYLEVPRHKARYLRRYEKIIQIVSHPVFSEL